MIINTTDKVWFRERSNTNKLHFDDKSYSLNKIGNSVFSDAEFLDIVENGQKRTFFDLASNHNLSTERLDTILEYKVEQVEEMETFSYFFDNFMFTIINHDNVSAEILGNIYEAGKKDNKILFYLSSQFLTPAHILVSLLPTEEKLRKNIGFFKDFEYRALSNLNTPVVDALFASQWVVGDEVEDDIWEHRYDELVEYLQSSQGLNVKDYPMEWVQELVWTGGVK